MRQPILYIGFLLLALAGTACNPTRRLQEGELFYQGAKTEFIGSPPAQQKKLEAQLLEMASPQPNEQLLGLYPRLGVYNAFANKQKGIGKWLREKLGRPPVTYNSSLVERSHLRMEKFLKDNGYLQATIRYDTLVKHRKATVNYRIRTGKQYTIGAVEWPRDTTPLNELLEEEKPGSLLKAGEPLQLSLLKGERGRLAQSGIEQG
ncbi:MAG: hypothetical protein KDD06_28595, partial [Phaeodactylibacter sp.]|nr:hypothetical protein [Phaeodactylibacter sp.]